MWCESAYFTVSVALLLFRTLTGPTQRESNDIITLITSDKT